ncbi:hypothetical protein [Natrarchaeobius oligotrophus]|uniref:hypothetical protein n=1 Tax=Natrarchaeobius oligotrophus TaxID=3455743 RepID=UPI0014045272|nr:hypothetical protein [Natrarchaeobius chitinivorans]
MSDDEVISLGQVLEKNDGNPQALFRHRDAAYSIVSLEADTREYEHGSGDLIERKIDRL